MAQGDDASLGTWETCFLPHLTLPLQVLNNKPSELCHTCNEFSKRNPICSSKTRPNGTDLRRLKKVVRSDETRLCPSDRGARLHSMSRFDGYFGNADASKPNADENVSNWFASSFHCYPVKSLVRRTSFGNAFSVQECERSESTLTRKWSQMGISTLSKGSDEEEIARERECLLNRIDSKAVETKRRDTNSKPLWRSERHFRTWVTSSPSRWSISTWTRSLLRWIVTHGPSLKAISILYSSKVEQRSSSLADLIDGFIREHWTESSHSRPELFHLEDRHAFVARSGQLLPSIESDPCLHPDRHQSVRHVRMNECLSVIPSLREDLVRNARWSFVCWTSSTHFGPSIPKTRCERSILRSTPLI